MSINLRGKSYFWKKVTINRSCQKIIHLMENGWFVHVVQFLCFCCAFKSFPYFIITLEEKSYNVKFQVIKKIEMNHREKELLKYLKINHIFSYSCCDQIGYCKCKKMFIHKVLVSNMKILMKKTYFINQGSICARLQLSQSIQSTYARIVEWFGRAWFKHSIVSTANSIRWISTCLQ